MKRLSPHQEQLYVMTDIKIYDHLKLVILTESFETLLSQTVPFSS